MRGIALIIAAVALVAVASLRLAPLAIGSPSASTVSAVASPGASPAASPGASPTADCTGVKAWLAATQLNLQQAAKIVQDAANPNTLSTATLQNAANQLATVATNQAALAAPPAAKQVSMRIADVLKAYTDTASQFLNAVKSKDLNQITGGMTKLDDANRQLASIQQELGQLASSCGAMS